MTFSRTLEVKDLQTLCVSPAKKCTLQKLQIDEYISKKYRIVELGNIERNSIFSLSIMSEDGELMGYAIYQDTRNYPVYVKAPDFCLDDYIFGVKNICSNIAHLFRHPYDVVLADQAGIQSAISFLTREISNCQIALLRKAMLRSGCEKFVIM